MPASIRGHKGQFKIFRNGVESGIVDLTKVTVNQDSSFMRTQYIGRPIPEGDQSIDGWSGQVEAEVKDDSIDLLIDALVTEQLNGIGVSDITFISTEEYPNGTSASYVYFDCQFKMSKDQGGQNAKMTKRLDFQASGRIRL